MPSERSCATRGTPRKFGGGAGGAAASSAGDLDEAVSAEADSAYDSYQDALGEIPGEAALSDAAPVYAAAAQAYLASLAGIAVDAGCETAS